MGETRETGKGVEGGVDIGAGFQSTRQDGNETEDEDDEDATSRYRRRRRR